MTAQRTRDGRPLSHWSVVGHDENGDLDGEVCRCEISDNHFTDGRPWPDDTQFAIRPRKVVRLHRILEDGGHWFCCGAGEEAVTRMHDAIDGVTDGAVDAEAIVTALLPTVETYARECVSERLVQAALYFDGYPQTTEIALGGQRYVVTKLHEMAADPSELYPCECPREHCGECGCCP